MVRINDIYQDDDNGHDGGNNIVDDVMDGHSIHSRNKPTKPRMYKD